MATFKKVLRLLPKIQKQAYGRQILCKQQGILSQAVRPLMYSHQQNNENAAKLMKIRSVKNSDLPTLTSLWKAEGIAISLDHMQAIVDHLCSEGLLVAELNGELVGAIINIVLSDTWAMQGGFITTAEARGKRLGGKILREGIQWLGDNRNIVGDAVPELVETYRRYGYMHSYDHDVSYSGVLDKSGILSTSESTELGPGFNLVDLQEVDFRKIMTYDRTHHPDSYTRTNYLKWHLNKEGGNGYVIMKGDAVVGLGARMSYLEGQYLGPIYAVDTKHGELLLRKLLSEIPDGTDCYVMVPRDNERANELITGVGLVEDAYAVRVATKYKYEMKHERYYGYTVAAFVGLSLS